jgi:hypothetical protein
MNRADRIRMIDYYEGVLSYTISPKHREYLKRMISNLEDLDNPKPLSENNPYAKKAIKVYSGVTDKVYNSMKQAAVDFKCSREYISRQIHGKQANKYKLSLV